MKVTKGQIELDRFLVPYRIYGVNGDTIVCVNGAQQTMAAWRSVISYFSKQYVVVTFDFPGQGTAGILSGDAISLNEQVEVLREIILRIHGYGNVNLFGSSWGGIIAAAFASRYQEYASKIILGSFGIKPNENLKQIIKKFRQLYEDGKGHEGARLITNSFGQRLPAAYKEKIHRQFMTMDDGCLRSLYAFTGFMQSVSGIHEAVNLRDIKAKTLIVNGQEDSILHLDDMKVAAAEIPACEIRIVPDAGHFLHFEREDILDIYWQFLSGGERHAVVATMAGGL